MLLTIDKVGLLFIIMVMLGGCSGHLGWSRSTAHGGVALESKFSREPLASPHNIALLLPLRGQGELGLTSKAIRNGFLATYDYFRERYPAIDIQVVDTTAGELAATYQQVVADGAEVVVGPLTKQEVLALTKLGPLPVPTIALNTLDNYAAVGSNNLYQFGLLPQDEAGQAAVRMVEQQLQRVAIIAPQGEWGDKITTLFANKYRELGGTVVATLSYQFGSRLAGELCQFLANDPETLCVPQRAKTKRQKEGELTIPKRRQDIDAIFLIVTTPTEARQIVPLIKFYYAGDLPLYSIATIYNGTSQRAMDQDIDGVYFCDMPWVLAHAEGLTPELQEIYKRISATSWWRDSFAKYSKFYALGVDGYRLAVTLNELLAAPYSGFKSATGVLYLDDFNHIYRELRWVQMRQGMLRVG